jgi:hypothetical protein
MRINFDNLQFHNFPKKFDKKDYEEVVHLAVSDLKRNPDVASIYLMGDNWTPGISDMDIIVVYKNNIKSVNYKNPKELSDKSEYIFTHDYINYDEESFKHMRFIYPSKYQLVHLYGKEIDVLNPEDFLSENEIRDLKASFVVDCIVNKLLSFPLYFKDNVDTRNRALLWMYSFVYTKKITEEVLGREIKSDFPEMILKLRKNFFDMNTNEIEKLLRNTTEEGFKLTIKLIEEINIFLVNRFGADKLGGQLKFESSNIELTSVKNWDKGLFLDSIKVGIIKKPLFLKQLKAAVPQSFFFVFKIYSSGNGVYSQWFKKMLNSNRIKVESSGIQKRTEFLNKLPVLENGRILTNTTLQYGFNSRNILKEKFKIFLINFFNKTK